MFITVIYGEKQEALFNTDCRLKLLLNSIREQCQCEIKAQVDLCEVSGSPKNLPQQPQESYATNYLNPRGKYVLIQMEKQNGKPAYKPLLVDKTIITEDFLACLEKELAAQDPPPSPKLVKKRNSLKPGRAGTPARMKRSLSVNKNSQKKNSEYHDQPNKATMI